MLFRSNASTIAIANGIMNSPVPGREDTIVAQSVDSPVMIGITVGNGSGSGRAWGCDLSYDYVKINAEYTT